MWRLLRPRSRFLVAVTVLVLAVLSTSVHEAGSTLSSPLATVSGTLNPGDTNDYQFTIPSDLDDSLIHVIVTAVAPDSDRLSIIIDTEGMSVSDVQGNWWTFGGSLSAGDHTLTAMPSPDAANPLTFIVEFYEIPTPPFTIQGTFPAQPYNFFVDIDVNIPEPGSYQISANAQTGNFAIFIGDQEIDVVGSAQGTVEFTEPGVQLVTVMADFLGNGEATAWSMTIGTPPSTTTSTTTTTESSTTSETTTSAMTTSTETTTTLTTESSTSETSSLVTTSMETSTTLTTQTTSATSIVTSPSAHMPSLVLTPTSGRAATSVTLSGLDYAGSSCTLSSSPSGLMSSSSCAISGSTLTADFAVASDAPLGCYVVTVRTNVPDETRTAVFCVTAASTTTRAGVITLTVAPAGAGEACGPGPTCTTGAAVAFDTSTFPGFAVFSIRETYDGYTFQYWQVDGESTGLPESGWSPWSSYPAWFSNPQQPHTVVAVFNPPAQSPAQSEPQQEQLPSCIIATAAYGSDMAPEVVYMRYVRDNLIGSTSIGRALRDGFLTWYYWWSPPIAQYMSDKPVLQAVFRVLLAPVSVSVRIADATFHGVGGGSLGSLLGFTFAAVFSILSYIVVPSVLLVVAVRWVRRTLGDAVSSQSPA